MNFEEMVIEAVVKACSENPQMVPKVIQAATEGVKIYAQRQTDVSSKLAFTLSEILGNNHNLTSGPISDRKYILDLLNPWFQNTVWMNNERNNLINQ